MTAIARGMTVVSVVLGLAGCGIGEPDGPPIVNATPNMVEILLPDDFPGSVASLQRAAHRRAAEHCADYGRQALYIGQTPRVGNWPIVATFACE
ncbi:hypothetical protein [Rhodospirillaceae bacterium SYSU D60014]|uniref:hypothetical protein n=1 Tax=Virgifigura deserti TaxID=2268457 RepID=UPI000E66BA97